MNQNCQPAYVNAPKERILSEDYFIEQFSLSCLGQFSYFVESNKEALVIDPIREIECYTKLATERGAQIKYVFLTHIHADFIAGHLELAEQLGAEIVFGPEAKTEYRIRVLKDEEIVPLGKVMLRVLHTPGHTAESSCFVLSTDKDHCVFTGDTLFLQEVGRPDLACKEGHVTKEMLASQLYHSLRNKIIPLADDVIVYPGHGAGSQCGKAIAAGTSSTIGEQKQKNYALSDISEEDFVKLLTDIAAPPQYYFHDAKLNKAGPSNTQVTRGQVVKPLSYDQSIEAVKSGAIILDSREDLTEGAIDGAINISFSAAFATYTGILFKPETKFVIVASPGKEELTIDRLLRIGYENIIGYLEGGFTTYHTSGGAVSAVNIVSLTDFVKGDNAVFVDVRNVAETETGFLPGAILIPLPILETKIDLLPKDKPLHIYCRTGPRAKTAMSILKNHGFSQFVLIQGAGTAELAKANQIELVK